MEQLYKNIIRVLVPEERRRLYFFILIDVLISIVDIISVAFLLLIINFYTNPQGILSGFIKNLFSYNNSILPVSFFVIFFCCKNFAGYLFGKAQYQFVYSVSLRLAEKNMLDYLQGSYTNYVTIDAAVQIKKISQQPIEFGHYVLWGLQQIVAQIMLITITLIAMLIFSTKLFLLLTVVLVPAVWLVGFLIKKKSGAAKANIKTSSEAALQYLKEGINGFVESKINNRNDFFTGRYVEKQQQLNGYLANLQAVQGIPNRIMEVFAVLGFFTLVVLNKWSTGIIAPTVMVIGAFMAAAYKIIPGMVKIVNSISMIKTYGYTINAEEENVKPAITKVAEKINTVGFKNVSFNYKEKKILSNFNCCLQKGNFIGITGPSGKGKTTIINLLLGFENEATGAVYFNEQPTNALQRQQYWNEIAYVKQQPFVMHDTIKSNIVLGHAGINHQKLAAAIEIAGINAMLEHFSEGINKIITEQGKNISGGQRQRIAIARAIYKDAQLIILDEPFNELDELSEKKLLQYFKQEAAIGKIVVLITHNKESLQYCNTIISLDDN